MRLVTTFMGHITQIACMGPVKFSYLAKMESTKMED